MASTWSSLKIELLETGANSGTWGTLTNVNLGDAVLGEAITGSATVDFATDADVTITLTDSATTQSARNLRLNITESSTGVGSVRNLILGSGCQIEKFYLINNTGTGAKTVKNTSGTGISVPAGKATLVYNNGTNVVDAATYFTALTLGSALPVASGGTGLASGTSGGVLAYTATGTLASSTALAASALVIGGGAGAAPSTTTTGTGVVTALGVNTGTAGAFVVNGGALGTPSSGTVTNLTGTASININGTVGATTATTGAFTTLSATGAVTLSGGTANGVAYLDASKVLTTGTALTFDGTTLSADTINNTQLYIGASLGTPILTLFGEAASIPVVGYRGSGGLRFGTVTGGGGAGFSEQMRLTSTGLGIGTSSPTTKLDVVGSGDSEVRIRATSDASLIFSETTANKNWKLKPSSGDFFWQYSATAYNSGYSALMALTSTGNLGLGVTPSAWGGSYKGFQVNSTGALTSNGSNATGVGHNYYFDGTNNLYLTTGAADLYLMISNEHRWYNAPSGTAGDPITFTQAMTLDASGNLLVGGTTAVQRITSTKGISANDSADSGIAILRSGTTYGSNLYHTYNSANGQEAFGITVNNNTTLTDAQYTKYLATSNGIHIWYGSTTAIERARIDSSGNLLVGTTSGLGTERLSVLRTVDSADYVAVFKTTAATATNNYGTQTVLNGDPNDATRTFLSCIGGASTTRAQIHSNGGLANYSANNVNLSDERTKTNIVNAGSYLAKICAIPVRTFKYKDQTDSLLNLGVIAQEVEAIAPELVDTTGFGETPDDGIPLKSIYQTDLQYALMKCIQEQQALITQLTARITALETA